VVTSIEATRFAAAAPAGELLPRYRRPLSFGAVLDETFRIFRHAWRPLMVILACAAIPVGVITAVVSGLQSGSLFRYMDAASTATASDDFGPLAGFYASAYGGGFVSAIVIALLLMPAYAAVVLLTDGEMRGRRLPVKDTLRRGLRATPPLYLLLLLGLVVGLLLLVASAPLLALFVFPGLFGLVPLVGILVWWGNPRARRPWLCWLVILTTPFGLAIYFTYRLILTLPAIVLEAIGPLEALRRSMTLTRGHWFRLCGSFTVLSIISSVLQAVPGWIITMIAAIISAVIIFSRAGSGDTTFTENPTGLVASIYGIVSVASAAARALGLTLVGALPPIALTLLFQDLRNRHEGADLAERLAVAEATGTPGMAAAATSPATDTREPLLRRVDRLP